MRLLALALLLAQEGLPSIPPRMPVDEEPTAFACTFDEALRGGSCTYEASSGAADARDNSGAALEAGTRACAVEGRRHEDLRKDCEKAVADVSHGARCAIAARLTDERGRLTPEARGCVEALRQAVGRTARASSLSLACCRCLGESRCSVAASQCRSELADLMPGPALRSCMAKSCQDACSFATPPAAPATDSQTGSLPPENHADKI
jgi:hypothetical protein